MWLCQWNPSRTAVSVGCTDSCFILMLSLTLLFRHQICWTSWQTGNTNNRGNTLSAVRQRYFRVDTLKELFEIVDSQNIIAFCFCRRYKLLSSHIIFITVRCTHCKARYCYRKSSVCPSVYVGYVDVPRAYRLDSSTLITRLISLGLRSSEPQQC